MNCHQCNNILDTSVGQILSGNLNRQTKPLGKVFALKKTSARHSPCVSKGEIRPSCAALCWETPLIYARVKWLRGDSRQNGKG